MDNFNFGQFRSSQVSSYLTNLTYEFKNILNPSVVSEDIIFNDNYIIFNDNNKLINKDGNDRQISYYLRFRVYKTDTEQKINLKLINSNKEKDNIQELGSYNTKIGDNYDYSTFEVIISPNQIYNQIKFDLSRISKDYTEENEDGTYGRKVRIEIERMDKIFNIIDFLSPSINNVNKLKQIGIQSAPGLTMCINGEQIKVGRSGLYEINNGINIYSIGFIVENNNKYFLLDYQY